jgi:hypothetical protein
MESLINSFYNLKIDPNKNIKGNYNEIDNIVLKLTDLSIDNNDDKSVIDTIVKKNINNINTPIDIIKIISIAIMTRNFGRCGDIIDKNPVKYVY